MHPSQSHRTQDSCRKMESSSSEEEDSISKEDNKRKDQLGNRKKKLDTGSGPGNRYRTEGEDTGRKISPPVLQEVSVSDLHLCPPMSPVNNGYISLTPSQCHSMQGGSRKGQFQFQPLNKKSSKVGKCRKDQPRARVRQHVLAEISKYQKSTELLIPKISFQHLVR